MAPDTRVVAVGTKGEPGAGIGDHEVSTSKTHIVNVTSSTRPTTGLFDGYTIFETDTDKYMRYTGTAWTDMIPAPPASSDERGKLICLVELKTTSIIIAQNAVATVIFNTVHVNEGDVYNNVTGILTLPAGTYRGEIGIAWSTQGSDNDKYSASLEVVSGTVLPSTAPFGTQQKQSAIINCSGGFKVTATATFRVRAGNGGGGNREIKDYTYAAPQPEKGTTTLAVYKA